MLKRILMLTVTLMAFSAFTQAFGADKAPAAKANTAPTAQGSGFVDANGDGVCDHHGTQAGKGKCQGKFVDANKDGVCDNFAERKCAKMEKGLGKCGGEGKGKCRRGR